ncbi:MAG: HIT family protein [Desulfovibrionaceae bacterium]|nr:HIT family protein [Desulfovibrionaceae bacterium]
MSDCIFCAMQQGKIPFVEVFSSDNLFAFLDIGPLNHGHVLIVPKKHYANMFDMPSELGCELLSTMQLLGKAIIEATGAGGLNVVQNNFSPAGQAVFHVHWHLIPRFEGDGLLKWTPGKYDHNEQMLKLAAEISRAMK